MLKEYWDLFREWVKNTLRSRIFWLGIVCTLFLAVLVVRLFQLQILDGAAYYDSYVSRTKKEITTTATRGTIYDRNGVVLAGNEAVYNLTVKDTSEYTKANGDFNEMLLRLIEIVKKYADQISVIVSEPDRGIYDAMNKAVDLAHNEWIIFMNSGDVFADNDTLKNVFNEPISKNISFIYSDFIVSNDSWKKKFIASYENGVLLHQSVIYKKHLHELLGKYIVTKKYIVSDYLFFLLQDASEVYKTNVLISVNQVAGVSAADWCGYQKLCFDYIFSRISISKLLLLLIDRAVKNFVKRLLRLH